MDTVAKKKCIDPISGHHHNVDNIDDFSLGRIQQYV